MTVSIAKQGRVAVVTIDNPPVNASSQAVRAGLLEALAGTEADPNVTAVDDQHAAFEFASLDGCGFARRARADDDKVVMTHRLFSV